MEAIIYKYLLPYLILYFVIVFLWPSYRVWKRTGIKPFTFSSQDTAHDYNGQVFKVLLLLLVFVGVIHSFFPFLHNDLVIIKYFDRIPYKITGITLLLSSLIWVTIAQLQMGNSWRVGIDIQNHTNLVATGAFSFSRNPVFLGMLLTLLGVFLVSPNVITAVVWSTGFVSLQVQVRLEEEYLRKIHGQKYIDYCLNVRRWL